MKTYIVGLIVGLLVLGCADTGTGSGRWKSLFDGRTLNGWTPKITGYPAGEDPLQTFRAKDGVLYVNYEKYDGQLNGRFGHLFYKEPLKAYHLALDYRFTGLELANGLKNTPVNSGIMFDSESPQQMALDQGYPISVEGQILGPYPEGPPRFTGSFCTMGTKIFAGGKSLGHCLYSTVAPSPMGTWVHFDLELTKDGHIIESIDGKVTATMDRVEWDPTFTRFPVSNVIAAAGGELKVSGGYIALQSEGHPIEFRNIRILSLE